MKVRAPGKIILSGEYSILIGNPALVMAVDRYVSATIVAQEQAQLILEWTAGGERHLLDFAAVRHFNHKIKHKYHDFLNGIRCIKDVLQQPIELTQFAFSLLIEAFKLSTGVKIALHSDIPIGCGMGSSAAAILSILHASAQHYGLALNQATLFELALQAEKMQHGHTTGLDLQISLQGGCLFVTNNAVMQRHLPQLPLYLVNTGKPSMTTGQCVEKVRPLLTDTVLANDFAQVTLTLDQAIQSGDQATCYQAIRANHQLLTQIGVVPTRVQHFIHDINLLHGAAKICGAGSITGDTAGMVLVLMEDATQLASLTMGYGYELLSIGNDLRGLHVV